MQARVPRHDHIGAELRSECLKRDLLETIATGRLPGQRMNERGGEIRIFVVCDKFRHVLDEINEWRRVLRTESRLEEENRIHRDTTNRRGLNIFVFQIRPGSDDSLGHRGRVFIRAESNERIELHARVRISEEFPYEQYVRRLARSAAL